MSTRDDTLNTINDALQTLIKRSQNDQVSCTLQDAANKLGLKGTKLVMKLIQKGDIRAVRPEGSRIILVSVKSLHEYIDGKE